MKDGVIIFSRMSSKRLYGKALLDIYGMPLLGRIIQRAKLVDNCKVVVATSEKEDDYKIINYCKKINIDCFIGNLDDVMKRAIDCAKFFNFDRFARVCGDRPLFDYKMINKFMFEHKNKKLDLITNAFPSTFPKGMTTEIISYESLVKINEVVDNQFDREHITNYYYQNPEKFKIKNLVCKIDDLSKYNLAVDCREDLKKINWIYNKLNNNILNPKLNDILLLLKQWERIK